jgi:LCP family protein required for cell wall assembly
MVSVPRDVSNLPLDTSEFPFWRGHLYGNRINSLMSYSARHPSQFGNMPPPEVIAHEVGYLIGIKVPYYATVDLAGFEKVVDLVGGVDIDNPRDLDDPTYPGGPNGAPMHFHLSAGPHHLDGATALKYARVRHSKCESDFSRAARQQQILTALRHQVQSPDVLPRVPALLNEAADLIRTNFPVARVGALVQLGAQVDEANVHKYVLAPPYSAQLPGSAKLGLNMARVATLSVALFGDDSRYHTTTPKGPLPEPARVTSCAGG